MEAGQGWGGGGGPSCAAGGPPTIGGVPGRPRALAPGPSPLSEGWQEESSTEHRVPEQQNPPPTPGCLGSPPPRNAAGQFPLIHDEEGDLAAVGFCSPGKEKPVGWAGEGVRGIEQESMKRGKVGGEWRGREREGEG